MNTQLPHPTPNNLHPTPNTVGREPPNDKVDIKLGRGASDGKAKRGKAAAKTGKMSTYSFLNTRMCQQTFLNILS